MSLAAFGAQDVERFTREFEALFNAGDAARMAAFYTADAKLLAEDTEPVQGRDAIERFWRAACDQARAARARRSISLQEVTSSPATSATPSAPWPSRSRPAAAPDGRSPPSTPPSGAAAPMAVGSWPWTSPTAIPLALRVPERAR